MNYLLAGLIWVLLLALALQAASYNVLGTVVLAIIGGVPGAIVTVWWQQDHQFSPPKLRPLFTDEKGVSARSSSYENIAMARQRQAGQSRRREGLVTRLLRQRSR